MKRLLELARQMKQYEGTHRTDVRELIDCIIDTFGQDQPCAMPEPNALPGVGKVEIPEDAVGLWDPEDSDAFAVMLLRRGIDARRGD